MTNTAKPVKINKSLARKVLDIVDAGLCSGVGKPIPGQMCIEAAVCYAMGLPHGDEPPCVSPAVRKLKIALNDAGWSSNTARAKGMRRLAIAQLGTEGIIDDVKFAQAVARISVEKVVPRALRNAAKMQKDQKHKDALEAAAVECEKNPSGKSANAAKDAAYAANAANAAAYTAKDAAAYAANAAANAAYAAAYTAKDAANAAKDAELSFFAEEVVQVLIAMKAPGAKWLDLTEAA